MHFHFMSFGFYPSHSSIMGEVLRNSILATIKPNGFACQHHLSKTVCCRNYQYCLCCSSAVKLTASHAGVREQNAISTAVKGNTWFECGQLGAPQVDLVIESEMGDSFSISNSVASVESELVCEEKEDGKLMDRGKEELGSDIFGQKLPPWGNLEAHSSLDFEPNSISQHSKVPKKMVGGKETRVCFLEERDEEELSRRILVLSRSNKIRSAFQLYRSMELSGLQPNEHACNSLLSCLLRQGLLDDALRLFEFMKTSKKTTGHTYSLILKSIANTQGCDSALKKFAELERYSIEKKYFDAIVYNTMISVCGRAENWVESERIWRVMKANGHIGTQVTYCLLVSIFVRCGQTELAIEAYNEMLYHGLKPGDDTMQAIIGLCSKEGKWEFALEVFQRMVSDGLKPNLIACNAVINSLGKAGKDKLAFKVFDVMKSLGHTPDVYSWNALLCALYKANRYADALQLFENIKREQKSELNVHLYNAALMSCQKLGLWDRALQLLWQMEASELSVPTASYNFVIGACEIARKPKVALQVYEHMLHQKCNPDTFTHLLLIRGCIWGSLWAEAEEILWRVEPNVSLYNAVVRGMCLRGKTELAKKLYKRMRKRGLPSGGKMRALMHQNLRRNSANGNGFSSCSR